MIIIIAVGYVVVIDGGGGRLGVVFDGSLDFWMVGVNVGFMIGGGLIMDGING